MEELARKGSRNLLLVIVVVAFSVAALYYYSQEQAKQIAFQQQAPATLAAQGRELSLSPTQVKSLTFSFTDEEYGFKIFYPKTYKAEENPDAATRLRFTTQNPASTLQEPRSAEVVDLRVFDSQDALEHVSAQEAAQKIAGEAGTQYEKMVSANGKPFFFVKGTVASDVTGEQLLLRAAFYDCKTREERAYTAALIAVIPFELEFDALYWQQIMKSFEC